jgi:hypothetical protein
MQNHPTKKNPLRRVPEVLHFCMAGAALALPKLLFLAREEAAIEPLALVFRKYFSGCQDEKQQSPAPGWCGPTGGPSRHGRVLP